MFRKRAANHHLLSYDADDAPVKEEIVIPQESAPEPESFAPQQSEPVTSDANYEAPGETPLKTEPNDGNVQNDDNEQSWNTDQMGGNHSVSYNDAQMEQDLPPIGIKEDG